MDFNFYFHANDFISLHKKYVLHWRPTFCANLIFHFNKHISCICYYIGTCIYKQILNFYPKSFHNLYILLFTVCKLERHSVTNHFKPQIVIFVTKQYKICVGKIWLIQNGFPVITYATRIVIIKQIALQTHCKNHINLTSTNFCLLTSAGWP